MKRTQRTEEDMAKQRAKTQKSCYYCGRREDVGDHSGCETKWALEKIERLTIECKKLREKASFYERDWRQAKHEFGNTTSKLRDDLRKIREEHADNLAAASRYREALEYYSNPNNFDCFKQIEGDPIDITYVARDALAAQGGEKDTASSGAIASRRAWTKIVGDESDGVEAGPIDGLNPQGGEVKE